MLGTLIFGTGYYAGAQEQQPSPVPEKRADENGSAKPEVNKARDIREPAAESVDRDNRVGLPLLKNIFEDQQAVWIGATHLQLADLDWLVPLGGATAAMIVTDTDYSRHLSNSPSRIKYSKDISNYGLASMAGIGGGLWVLGHITHDDQKIETGVLAGEAAIDTLAPVYGMKYAFGRQRPLQDNYRGQFWSGGDSFPSQHAAAAWSIASIIAHEYPGPLTSIFVYGLASAVSASRISAKQHFASDVLVGSAVGWLEGMYVYRKHHDAKIGGGDWETYAESHDTRELETGNLASPYVPLDSWIYSALERLAGLGLLSDEFMGLRPWTRRECARLVGDAEEKLPKDGRENNESAGLIEALKREFREEIDGDAGLTFRVESLYSRTEHISGMPLTDGYDLGQTQINDFGRPLGQGWSTVNGFSAYGTSGRWVAYVRGEEQSAPSIPALPLSARQAIEQSYENVDNFTLPLKPGTPQSAVNQLQLVDAYVGVMLSNWQISFGRQSLYWGAGDGGSLELSNNAQPINMFRISRTAPLKLPSVLGWLGPLRTEFFLGQLTGFNFIDAPTGLVGQWEQALPLQPFIHGENISFRPSRNFEFGFYRTTIFGGQGYPFTFRSFERSLFSGGNTNRAAVDKPGNRTSGLDFSYRLPHLRNWLTFYGDGYTDDQFSPIAYADRSAWHAGLFLSHVPMIPKLDLRAEGVYTDVPAGAGPIAPGVFYANGTWTSGYTNNGQLLGSWVGRGGQGAQAWTNYWFNARNRLQFNFRHQKVSQVFLSRGGTLTDVGARADYWFPSNVGLTASVQYERWLFPVIQPNAQTNVTAYAEIQFQPRKAFHRQASTSDLTLTESGDMP